MQLNHHYCKEPYNASTIWVFGLPCSGKATFATELCSLIRCSVLHIDCDTIRGGLNKDLSFSPEDSLTNVTRAAHVAKMVNDQGITCVVSMITSTKEMRNIARSIIGNKNIRFVWISTELEICKKRDQKNRYINKGLLREAENFEKPTPDENVSLIFDAASSTLDNMTILAAGLIRREGL